MLIIDKNVPPGKTEPFSRLKYGEAFWKWSEVWIKSDLYAAVNPFRHAKLEIKGDEVVTLVDAELHWSFRK